MISKLTKEEVLHVAKIGIYPLGTDISATPKLFKLTVCEVYANKLVKSLIYKL